MGKITGFLEISREHAPRRPVEERIGDWLQVYTEPKDNLVQAQGARCMDCGVPFCHTGCPLGNIIPDWNDLVYRNRWKEAIEVLHKTNNFPEFTGWVCPAPCEAACVLGINNHPVTIKQIEISVISHAGRYRAPSRTMVNLPEIIRNPVAIRNPANRKNLIPRS